MHGNHVRGAALALVLAVLAAGCSSSKYENQIEQQKLQISELQQKNYQLEMEASKQRAMVEEANRKAAEMPPADGGSAALGGETAGVWMGGGSGAGTTVSETIVLDSAILFSSGSANLTAKGTDAVKTVAGQIKKKYPGALIRVQGHTDNVPIKKAKYASNMELSTARAESVAKVLRQQGIAGGKIEVEGFADGKPRGSNATAAGRAQNRRVEIVVLQ